MQAVAAEASLAMAQLTAAMSAQRDARTAALEAVEQAAMEAQARAREDGRQAVVAHFAQLRGLVLADAE